MQSYSNNILRKHFTDGIKAFNNKSECKYKEYSPEYYLWKAGYSFAQDLSAEAYALNQYYKNK